MSALDDITSEVSKIRATVNAAITVIDTQPADNSAQLSALAADLATSEKALADAIAAKSS